MSTLPPGHNAAAKPHIKVMLVDDSAVIRGILTRTLESDPEIKVVSSVSNGELGVSAAKTAQPHVVILDIEMPVMDGLTALPKILANAPRAKVIMFSSLTEKGATVTLKAFSLGAVECIVKPTTNQNTGEGSEFQKKLVQTVKNLVRPEDREAPSTAAAPAGKPGSLLSAPFKLHNDPAAYKGKPSIVAIGSSTGGPQALFTVIKSFKDFDVPIVITQHMPATFTKILAQHIEQQTGIKAHEGADGMVLEKGHVYVAPGGYHMVFVKTADNVSIQLNDGPPENFCKPSVDPMFRSALSLYGNKMLGVILTGMGGDGLEGGKGLVAAGGRMIAQDEATSVVWGMPGAAAKAGICSAVMPLNDIGPWIRMAVTGKVV